MSQFPDRGLRAILFEPETLFHETLPPREEKIRNKIWLMQDRYHCRYILSCHPESAGWITGPYLVEDMSLTDITRLYQRRGLPHADVSALRQYYLSLPRIRDENILDALIHAYCSVTYGEKGYEIGYWKMETTENLTPAPPKPVQPEYVVHSMERRYGLEKQLMDFVSQGNEHGATRIMNILGSRGIDSRTNSTLRDAKDYLISLNTLCRLSAVSGGAGPITVDRQSTAVVMEIENAASMMELRTIRDQMLGDYCSMVRAEKKTYLSPLIADAVDRIESDYEDRLSLGSVAEALAISPNYLSQLFHRETGETFSEFLCRVRLNHACQLLQNTETSVGEIAGNCGIPDQNYFARLFKEKYHMSPMQYRKKCRTHHEKPSLS